MRCPYCATENPDGAHICRKCGQALAPAPAEPAPKEAAETAYAGEWKDDPDLIRAENAGKRKGKRARRIVTAIAVAAIVLVLVVVGGRVVVDRLYSTQISVAQQFLDAEDYADAAQSLERAVRLKPAQAQGYLLLAQAFTGTEDYDRGVELLTQGAERTGDAQVQAALADMQAKQADAKARDEQKVAAQTAAQSLSWAVEPQMEFDSLTVPGTQRGAGGTAYEGLPDYTGTVLVKKGSAVRLLDDTGHDLVPDGYTLSFDDAQGLLAVRTDGSDAVLWRVGPDGSILGRAQDVPTQDYRYENGQVVLAGSDTPAQSWQKADLLPVYADGEHAGYAFVDETGAQVGDLYDDAGVFHEGLAAVEKDGKWGYLDKTGAVAIPFLFDDAQPFQGGLAAVILDGDAGFIEPDGTLALGFCYEDARSPYEGKAWVKQDGKWGVLDLNVSGRSQAWQAVYLQKLQDLSFPLARSSVLAGLWDWNEDGTPELFLSDGTVIQAYTVAPGTAEPIACLLGSRLYAGESAGTLSTYAVGLSGFHGDLAELGVNDAAAPLCTAYASGVLTYRFQTSGVGAGSASLLTLSNPATYLLDGDTVSQETYAAAFETACAAAREIPMQKLTAASIADLDTADLQQMVSHAGAQQPSDSETGALPDDSTSSSRDSSALDSQW